MIWTVTSRSRVRCNDLLGAMPERMERMLKYKTKFEKIEAVEILRETEHQVVLPPTHTNGKERREQKRCYWYAWHDSWDDAHAYLVAKAQADVDSLRLQLARANGKLGNIKGMKKPETPNA